MQLFQLVEAVLAGISIVVILLLFFIVLERYQVASGKEMFTDKCINYLEKIHNLTALKSDEKADVREYYLSGKVKIMEVYFHERPDEKNQVETSRGETNG
ncbi:hypothetical protein [Desulfosporosinus sp. SB140]|uniref:hypothetical protein n=1 Tax=Desulfosporosinus paludis TaxID=3115649 RepID=UPI00388EB06A